MVLCETKQNEMVLCETVLCKMVLCEMVLCEMALCKTVLCEMGGKVPEGGLNGDEVMRQLNFTIF